MPVWAKALGRHRAMNLSIATGALGSMLRAGGHVQQRVLPMVSESAWVAAALRVLAPIPLPSSRAQRQLGRNGFRWVHAMQRATRRNLRRVHAVAAPSNVTPSQRRSIFPAARGPRCLTGARGGVACAIQPQIKHCRHAQLFAAARSVITATALGVLILHVPVRCRTTMFCQVAIRLGVFHLPRLFLRPLWLLWRLLSA